jgi:glycogen debranching enzyme
VMAVAEANYGRLDEAVRYLRAIAAATDLEMPGALPEVLPSPDYDVFGDLHDRLMFMQAWSAYGVQWPIVNHFLGIRPDAPTRTVTVTPNLPPSLPRLGIRNLRIGDGVISVTARRTRDTLTLDVDAPPGWRVRELTRS